MKVDIFHASDDLFAESVLPGFAPHRALAAFEDGRYDLVHTFDSQLPTVASALEDVYAASQNIDGPWCDPPHRSTSMGDILRVDGELYMVAMLGFEPLRRS